MMMMTKERSDLVIEPLGEYVIAINDDWTLVKEEVSPKDEL